MPLIGSGLLSSSGAPAFVGAYDGISNLAAVYSVRRVLSTYTGPLLRLRRDSDNAESDFGYVANGDLDTAAIATWLGGATGYVTTWYDQGTGGLDATMATAAAQPRFSVSLLGGKPGFEWFDTARRRVDAAITFPATMHCVGIMATTGTGGADMLSKIGAAVPSLRIHNISDQPLLYLNTENYKRFAAQTTWRDGNPHAHSVYIPGTGQNDVLDATYRLDGTALAMSSTSVTNSPATTATSAIFDAPTITNGGYTELIISSAQLSTADHNTIGASMASYYGLTWNTIT